MEQFSEFWYLISEKKEKYAKNLIQSEQIAEHHYKPSDTDCYQYSSIYLHNLNTFEEIKLY